MTEKNKKKIMIVFGTRPEAIKLAPLVMAVRRSNDFTPIVCVFRQHKEMMDQVLSVFNLKPDFDLPISISDRALFGHGINVFSKFKSIFESGFGLLKFLRILHGEKPEILIVQGDTFTAFLASLLAFYCRVKVGHVEAGLRTNNKLNPFPEEINRRLISVLSDIHFAPTELAKNNLLRENVPTGSIFVTGNTIIDAIRFITEKSSSPEINAKWKGIFKSRSGPKINSGKIVLVTAHRRESFGEGLKNICDAVLELASKHKDVSFVYPVHQNPNVRKTVLPILSNKENIHLIEPLEYESFVHLMKNSHHILTDSGGIQEEVSYLAKPAVVMRNFTERGEGIVDGNIMLVGTDRKKIVDASERLLKDEGLYGKMAMKHDTYGDGHASEAIILALNNLLSK